MLSALAIGWATPVQQAAQLEQSILDGKLEEKSEQALGNLIQTAAGELRRKGHAQEADQMESEWFNTFRYTLRTFATSRNIGDHKPLSEWLAKKYDMLEFILGIDLCKKMHLSDLKTFNFCIPVVFKPCNPEWNKDEYRNHFSKDPNYYGLLPVVSYWLGYGICVGASMGTGFVFVCGLLGDTVERLVGQFVSDGLSDRVYERACGGRNG